MSSLEPQSIRERAAPASLDPLPIPWSGQIRHGKLRRPESSPGIASRPRVLDLIDQGSRPLTLIVAPAGFGKTVAAAEWAALPPRAGWLTADSGDTSLPRFWAHLREALAGETARFGDLVQASLSVPHRPSALDLGRLLADELLDAREPVRLVLDDVHLIAHDGVFDFLAGLLEAPPPKLRLIMTSRREPPLALPRMRIRGTINEIRAGDLLFSEDETREFLHVNVPDGRRIASANDVRLLWRRTGGWAAGLRLAPVTGAKAGPAAEQAKSTDFDSRLAALLLEETLEDWSPAEKRILLCSAVPARFNLHLLTTLTDDTADIVTETMRFARSADLCHPSSHLDDDWLEFHPLFREALLHQLKANMAPAAITRLHRRAAGWFEEAGMIGAAIDHWLGAGDLQTAAHLVERQLHRALAQEDWPSMARFLARLPDDLVQSRPQLMMGRAWIAHLRGRYGQKREIVRAVEAQLAQRPLEAAERAALYAELEVLKLDNVAAVQADPLPALANAQRALDALTEERRYPIGIVWLMIAAALQSMGELDAAEAALQRLFEQTSDRMDAGSIRGLHGLCLLALQEGDLQRVESYARTLVELAARDHLRLIEGWGRAFLGDVFYDRNELDQSIAYNALVARDHEYCHFYCILESQFTLAQAYLAAGRAIDARRTRQRTREILIEATAVEQLPVFDAHDAYLSLLLGDVNDALTWAATNQPATAISSLYAMLSPALIRALIFCAVGDERQLQEAAAVVGELRAKAVREHFIRPLVRLDALAAIIHLKRGERQEAGAAMRRSLDVGLPRGYVRAYLDLLRLFPNEMTELLANLDLPVAFRSMLNERRHETTAEHHSEERFNPVLTLTERELQILAALNRRLTYDEIANQLFISPHTVKRHACNIYAKLGVSGRAAALRVVQEMGWRPGSAIR